MIQFLKRLVGLSPETGKDLSHKIHGQTHVGRVRKGNEDYFLIHLEKKLYIASDGMGGHNAGEVASLNATQFINRYFSTERLAKIRGDREKIKAEMIECLCRANLELREMAKTNKGYRGMGCTIVMALVDGENLHLCHVGDSRAYLCNRSGLKLLTTDHSLVMSLVANGKMTMEEARLSPIKNELTQAIGAMKAVQPDHSVYPLKKKDRLLLCSDGLWDMLPDKEIHRVIKKNSSAKTTCEELIRLANEAGGKDNITVVVLHQPL